MTLVELTTDKLVIDAIGLTAIALTAWFFWFGKKQGVAAAVTSSGYQEAMVLVKGGYSPDVIVVQAGKPVRLSFVRQESAACSEMVLIPDFGKSAHLPEGETVSLEFMPQGPGEHEFQCQMGMFRGKVVVNP